MLPLLPSRLALLWLVAALAISTVVAKAGVLDPSAAAGNPFAPFEVRLEGNIEMKPRPHWMTIAAKVSEELRSILGVGEKTGDIAIALERAAKRYDRELTSKITILTTLIQSAIILFVALVAYSMIAGILTSVSSLKVR